MSALGAGEWLGLARFGFVALLFVFVVVLIWQLRRDPTGGGGS